MTDQELLELVRRKQPGEMSSAEISALRLRLPESAELRDELANHLRLEESLNSALAPVHVSIDAILAAVAATPPMPPRPWMGWYGWGLGSILVLMVGGSWWFAMGRREEPVALAPPAATEDASPDAALSEAQPAAIRENEKDPPVAGKRTADQPVKQPAAAFPAQPQDEPAAVPADAPPENVFPAEEASPSDQAEPGPLLFEAESFLRGNARIDAARHGQGIGVLESGDVRPLFVEYEIEAPQAAEYELRVRYATAEPRAFSVQFAGRTVEMEGQDTGGWMPESQAWFTVGVFRLAAGKHPLRLQAAGPLPLVDQLALAMYDEAATGEGPWTVALDSPAAPSFAEAATLDFDALSNGLPFGELKQWLTPAAWKKDNFVDRPNWSPSIDGLLKLNAPWPENAVLRLALFEHHQFQIHFWRGKDGVTLQYFEHPRPTWCAYAASRANLKEQRPGRMYLAADDHERHARLAPGSIDIRWHEGRLIVSQADIVLFSAPLVGRPIEVYLEGKAMVRDLAMHRSAPPELSPVARPVAQQVAKPAAATWLKDVPEESWLKPLADGRLELVTRKNARPAWAAVPLEKPGLYEYLFEVHDPQPGTGVYLGDRRGAPLYRVGFIRDERSGRTAALGLHPQHDIIDQGVDPGRPGPFVGKQVRVRMVVGPGICKAWIGVDGWEWAALQPVSLSVKGQGPVQTVGIYSLAGKDPRGIRLAGIEVREFAAVEKLAPAELRDAALSLADDDDLRLSTWLRQVLEGQPPQADPHAWRRACALQTLRHGPPQALGNDLLLALLDDGLALTDSTEGRLELLEEISLLADCWGSKPGQRNAERIVRQYERAAADAAQAGLDSMVIGRGLLQSPLQVDQDVEFLPPGLVRQALLTAAHRASPPDAAHLANLILRYNRSCYPSPRPQPRREDAIRLALAIDGARPLYGGNPDAPRRAAGHPLIEEVGKEAFNVLGDFKAAVQARAYLEACRMITTVTVEPTTGLLPQGRDPRLLTSLSAAIDVAYREHPELERTMQQRFAPEGRIRVRRAQESGDVAALEAATLQFRGTDAAADAHLWLGDRALSLGRLSRASSEYRRGSSVRNLPASLREALAARQRLAAAMTGRDFGKPVTKPVEFAGETLTAAEFERLVADLRTHRHTPQTTAASAGAPAAEPMPLASAVPTRAAGMFDGPGASEAPTGEALSVRRDPVARQLAAAVIGSQVVVSNRTQITAFDAQSGERRWSSNGNLTPGLQQSWLFAAMRPVNGGDRLFVRRLTGKGPILVCLQAATGELLWSTREERPIASDPLLVQDLVLAFTVETLHDRTLQLMLAAFDPQTGDLVSERPVIKIRDHWNRQLNVEAVVRQNRLLAAAGGSVFCCDTLGALHWLRRQSWFSTAHDLNSWEQDYQPPLVVGQMVCFAQPGVRSVEAVALEDGRLLWQHLEPRLMRVVGHAGDRVILRTGEGLVGLQASDGTVAWRFAASELLESEHLSQRSLVIGLRETLHDGKLRPRLVWLDPQTGQPQSSAPLDSLVEGSPQLGPLVRQAGKTWAFFGTNTNQAHRQLLELADGAPMEPLFIPVANVALSPAWSLRSEPAWQAAVQSLMPGWALLDSDGAKPAGRWPELGGERDVLVTRTDQKSPAIFARWIEIPAGGTGKLLIRAGCEGERVWRLDVRAAGKPLTQGPLTPGADGWQSIEVDLSSLAGSGAWLTVAQQVERDAQAAAWWRALDVQIVAN